MSVGVVEAHSRCCHHIRKDTKAVDRGKPGSKIHAITDQVGLPLHVNISAANLNDHRMLDDMVDGLTPAWHAL